MAADPSLASTLRAVTEARKAAWAKGEPSLPVKLTANAEFMMAATRWVESHGEAAAAALERAAAVEEAAWAVVRGAAYIPESRLEHVWIVDMDALRTALEGRST